MKKCFSVPSLSLVVILDVEAKLDPAPAPDWVVFSGSRDRSWVTAESIAMMLSLLVRLNSLLVEESMKILKTQTNVTVLARWYVLQHPDDIKVDHRSRMSRCQPEFLLNIPHTRTYSHLCSTNAIGRFSPLSIKRTVAKRSGRRLAKLHATIERWKVHRAPERL